MARLLRQTDPASARERIRAEELVRVRERAARCAAIVVRLPRDLEQVPASEARADLLREFGLTAAMEAKAGRDPQELVADTACHYSYLFGQRGGSWIRDEHYRPGWDEVLAIAAEELEHARGR